MAIARGPIVALLWGLALGRASAQTLPCREDARLAEAAAEILLSGAPVVAAELLSRARARGFDGVSVHARESASDEALRAWLASLGRAGEGSLVCGEASSEARRLVLASLRGGRLWREGGRVRGQLEPGFAKPSLVLEAQGGALSPMPLTRAQLQRGFALPSERPLRRVQLVAESASGPRPVAELAFEGPAGGAGSSAEPIALEARPASELLLDRAGALSRSAAPEAPAANERSLQGVYAALASLRRGAGVGALRDNRLLQKSAHGHAARVCELGRLAHRLDGEDPALRLRREHLIAREVGEALARADSFEAAWRALLDSPSHRLALTRRDFTDVGIGAARDRKGQLCLVVLMAAWPRRAP